MRMNERLSSMLEQRFKSEEQNKTYAFHHNASKAMRNKDDRPSLSLHNVAISSQHSMMQ